MPKISIILPAFNAERWIWAAVSSILRQDYDDFELIILNDGSTDRTGQIIKSIKDRRVISVLYQKNSGYSRRLNEGLQLSKGEFVARMDADDLALRSRLSNQLRAFESDLTLRITGTWTYQIDSHGLIAGEHRCPTSHADIAVRLLSNVTLIHHPTVMFRRSALEVLHRYDESFEPAEDFEMWTRAVIASQQMAVIPNHLLMYRRHEEQVSSIRRSQQWIAGERAVSKLLVTISRGRLTVDQRSTLFNFLAGQEETPAALSGKGERQLVNSLLEVREVLAEHVGFAILDPFVKCLKISRDRLSGRGEPMLAYEIYHATMRGRPI